ncbi:hypothetical protein IHE44_0001595 [Lamprotornis superbus]|uniref:Homeobox domain-containing protein n=1 Tax=Lamprotornis superbus TaxID=245042 RepID=A0A835NU42_9PASS|nr:hypothetical protein IHE44_0001595 [Lamprotornis superbus]
MRLSEVQIKTWFQNRRMKLKRQLQELRTEPFCSPALPYGPQGAVVPLPLTYVARPPPLAGQGAASEGCPLAALPAPALDLSSACRAQPVAFWAAPCFVGYRDPRAFLLEESPTTPPNALPSPYKRNNGNNPSCCRKPERWCGEQG